MSTFSCEACSIMFADAYAIHMLCTRHTHTQRECGRPENLYMLPQWELTQSFQGNPWHAQCSRCILPGLGSSIAQGHVIVAKKTGVLLCLSVDCTYQQGKGYGGKLKTSGINAYCMNVLQRGLQKPVDMEKAASRP